MFRESAQQEPARHDQDRIPDRAISRVLRLECVLSSRRGATWDIVGDSRRSIEPFPRTHLRERMG